MKGSHSGPATRHLLLLLLLFLAGCRGCGGGPAAPGEPASEAPRVPQADARVAGLLAHLPADTRAVLVVADLQDLSTFYESQRERAGRLTRNLGVLESDLRNTLGFDLRHPRTVAELGVAWPTTLAVTVNAEGRWTLWVTVAQPARLEEHLTRVLQGQPFNLRGPVEARSVPGGRAVGYRRAPGAPIASVAVFGADWAAWMPEESSMEVATALVQRDQRWPSEGWQEGMTRLPRTPLYLHGTAPGVLQLVQRLGGASASRIGAGDTGALHAISVALEAREDAWVVEAAIHVSPRAARQFQEMRPQAEPVPSSVGPLLTDQTWGFFRLGLQPRLAWTLLLEALPEARRTAAEDTLDRFGSASGLSGDALWAALGEHVFGMATQTRILTLRRALADPRANPGGLFTSLGVVLAVHLRDPDRVRTALRAWAEASEEADSVWQSGEDTVLEFSTQTSDIGAVVVSGPWLLLVPSRDRESLLESFRAQTPNAWLNHPQAGPLLQPTGPPGAFLDLQAILAGPLGSFLTESMSRDMRRALGMLQDATLEAVDLPLHLRWTLRFRPLDTPVAE